MQVPTPHLDGKHGEPPAPQSLFHPQRCTCKMSLEVEQTELTVLCCRSSLCWYLKAVTLLGAVVFGQVVDGMDIVKAIEAVGSSSGKPSQQVTIADAGEVSA